MSQYKTSRVETESDRDLLLETALGSGVRVWNNVDKQLHMGDGETPGGVVVGNGVDGLGAIAAAKFGIVEGGSTDNASRMQDAVAEAAETGGIVAFPPGKYDASLLEIAANRNAPVRVIGAGKRATVFGKFGGGTGPVVVLDAGTGGDAYGGFADFTITGGDLTTGVSSKTNIGMQVIAAARFQMDRVGFEYCNVGCDIVGGLIFDANDCTFNSNNIGLRARKSTSNVYANLITVRGGEFRQNTTMAADIDNADSLVFRRVDFEQNGTLGNTATGAIKFGPDMANETGFSAAVIDSCWFEGNMGMAVRALPTSAGPKAFRLSILGATPFYGNEGDYYIDGIYELTMAGVNAPSPSATRYINVIDLTVEGGSHSTLPHTASGSVRINTRTAAARLINNFGQATIRAKGFAPNTNDLLIAGLDELTGGDARASGLYKQGTFPAVLTSATGEKFRWGSGGVGFFGLSTINDAAVLGSAATDAATTQALVNAIRVLLINVGLGKVS